jgi:DNA-binding phage protein
MRRKPIDYNTVLSSPSRWQKLLVRVRRLVDAPGAKAGLARELGVTRQAVNKWLTEEGAPSAEITLRLLEWVEAAEAQQKTDPGGASTPPGQMAQQRKSTINEKPKPGRRKASGKNPP